MMEFVRNMKKKVKQGFGRLYQNKPLFYKSVLFCFIFLLSLISTFLLPYTIYKDVDIKHLQEVFYEKEVYAEKILEVKEEGENINIYGTSSGDGERIEDIIIFVPDNCELICLFGSVSIQQISDIVKMSNE